MMNAGRVLLVAVAFSFCVCGLPVSVCGAEVPYLSGRVNDSAGLLSPDMAKELEALLQQHEDSTSNQVVLLTIPTLEGEQLEEYSIKVVDNWKLGRKGKDNGVLLLVVRDDRKVRIEVGRGLEGDLPDITCGTIIRKEIVPRFKEGEYEAGIHNGIVAILAAIKGSYAADAGNDDTTSLGGKILMSLFFLAVVGVFTALVVFTKGGGSWFLYFFLYPFWSAFPMAIFGLTTGLAIFLSYAVGVLLLKWWFAKSTAGQALFKNWSGSKIFGSSVGSWSSGGGTSSGGSFSGGGGSFSGGGASGSW